MAFFWGVSGCGSSLVCQFAYFFSFLKDVKLCELWLWKQVRLAWRQGGWGEILLVISIFYWLSLLSPLYQPTFGKCSGMLGPWQPHPSQWELALFSTESNQAVWSFKEIFEIQASVLHGKKLGLPLAHNVIVGKPQTIQRSDTKKYVKALMRNINLSSPLGSGIWARNVTRIGFLGSFPGFFVFSLVWSITWAAFLGARPPTVVPGINKSTKRWKWQKLLGQGLPWHILTFPVASLELNWFIPTVYLAQSASALI